MARSHAWKRVSWFAFALAAPLFVASEARAEEACGESTCSKGFTCEVSAGACPDIACVEGAKCPPCEPQDYHYCVPATCTSALDCGTDQVCAAHVVSDCGNTPGKSCPPGEECAPAEPSPPCEPTTVSYCTPRWQLPCTAAADCGAGFDCVPQERCSSSGSSGTGTAPSGSTPGSDPSPPTPSEPPSDDKPAEGFAAPAPSPTPVPEPPTVTCEPTGVSACVPIQVACDDDSDCVSGWTCQSNPNGACWSGPDGGGCTPVDPAKLCVPPYGGVPRGTPATGGNDASGSDGSAPPTTPGATPTPETPRDDPATGAPVPASAEEDDAAADPKVEDGGCSMSAAPSHASGLAWLAAGLAAVFGIRRRR